MGQERIKRPVGSGTGSGDAGADSFEQVSLPPVDEIKSKLEKALKQKAITPCAYGCYCEPCTRGVCSDCDVDKGRLSKADMLKRGGK